MGEEEAMLHKGGCACTQVQYEITADPLRMINCHCRDCQRATGSAYAPLLVFPADSVRVKGDLRYFAVTSERGSKVERRFCPNCGNPVLVKIDDRPDKLYVLAASLDDPSLHRPQANGWMRSATPWDHVDPNVPAFETH
jgi:hypothetical protein